ncbi:hypothetical protein E2562_015191 [Oryza meyeriana var. granulata]|uniref:Uncharacterized protein n=1 Tax=Oryza meyeriana var. granulata TaxID=110450 RepID=A0A6G1EWR6_9ORYZ|nr:hypothetical protein E2562_015191 [Oryza meyeriana var. granulata]
MAFDSVVSIPHAGRLSNPVVHDHSIAHGAAQEDCRPHSRPRPDRFSALDLHPSSTTTLKVCHSIGLRSIYTNR